MTKRNEALAFFDRPRAADTHKGDYGKVLILAGSEGMTGAAMLCASAALHTGAGLVYLAAPRGLLPIYETALPEAVKCPVGTERDYCFAFSHLGELLRLSADKDVIAVGPGLGAQADTRRMIRTLLTEPAFAPKARAVILDADGLNAWEREPERLREVAARFGGKLILTPHEGEMARLTGMPAAEIHADRASAAVRLATELSGAWVVLKGSGTVVTNGDTAWRNTTGNAGMATGGSGDVLTGMIAGLAATDGKTTDTGMLTRYAVWLHGFCGDRAAERYGERYLTARLIIEEIGEVHLYGEKHESLA